jgi:hypothetical protein
MCRIFVASYIDETFIVSLFVYYVEWSVCSNGRCLRSPRMLTRCVHTVCRSKLDASNLRMAHSLYTPDPHSYRYTRVMIIAPAANIQALGANASCTLPLCVLLQPIANASEDKPITASTTAIFSHDIFS